MKLTTEPLDLWHGSRGDQARVLTHTVLKPTSLGTYLKDAYQIIIAWMLCLAKLFNRA